MIMALPQEIQLSRKARFLWGLVIALTITIYSTLSLMGNLFSYLSQHLGRQRYSTDVDVILAILLISFALYLTLGKRVRGCFDIVTLIILFLAAGASMCLIEYPAKRFHFPEYGLLGGLIFTAFSHNLSGNRLYLSSVALVSLLGGIDEIIQHFLPNRHGKFQDWMIDVAAGMIGIAVAWVLNRPHRANPAKQTLNEIASSPQSKSRDSSQ